MPSPIKSLVPCALLSEFDASQWAGVNVFDRGADHITLASDAGVYDDALAFLHGFGSQTGRSLAADLQSRWTAAGGGGDIFIGIDEDDRVYIETDTEDFTLDASAGWAYLGFSAAGHGLVGGSAPYRRTATSDWTRGPLTWGTTGRLLITPAVGSQATLPRYTGTVQSLPTWIRAVDEADADGVWDASCLETLDNTAADNADRRIRWGINAAGHVYTTRPTGVAAAVTWVSTSFRDRLGFSGNETEVTSNGVVTLTADYELPGLLRPTGLSRCLAWREESTATARESGGGVAYNHLGSWSGWDVTVYVAGDALGDESVTEHLIRRVWPYAPLGAGLTLYREWGDPRRALRRREVTAAQPAYDLLYTSERDGARGRLRCLRDPGDEARRQTQQDQDLMVRQTVRIILTDRVD